MLYVGGLSPSAMTKNLTDFINDTVKVIGQHTPTVYNMKIFRKEDRGDKFIGAGITIWAISAELLSNYSFGPSRVYARQWKFRADNPMLPKLESTANVELGRVSDEAAGEKFFLLYFYRK